MKKNVLLSSTKKNYAMLGRSGKLIQIAAFGILFFFCLVFSASSQSLSLKYTLNFEKAKAKEVLLKLKEKGGISFVYDEEHLKQVPLVTYKFKDASLEQVLDRCLNGTDLSYEIKSGTVVIQKKKSVTNPAQKKRITGHVVDETGNPMPGVTIGYQRPGNTRFDFGTTTDIDGNFQLLASEPAGNLVFSFVGYKNHTADVEKVKEVLKVAMEPDLKDIREVVVTGIFTRKTESYTGASNMVTADQLKSFGNRDVLSTIRNIDPSFNIIENNIYGSDPNRLPSVQIRGNSSLPNVSELYDEVSAALNTPLVILDGFQSSMSVLMNMNENDIESITILKDAQATSIYGSRGANGVVVITTKQPQGGDLRVTLRSDMNVEIPDLTQYSVLDAREKLDLEKTVGLYNDTRVDDALALKRYYNQLLSDVNRGVDTYWLSKPLRTGMGQKHSIKIEGGDKRFKYSGSVQYNEIPGVMKGSSRNTFNGDIKLAYSHNNLRFSNNITIGIVRSKRSPYGNFSDYVKMNPYWTGYDDNGKVLKQLGYYGTSDYYFRWNKLPVNPLYNATLNTFDKSEDNSITNNTMVDWTPSKSMRVRAQLGIKKLNGTADVFKPADHTDFAKYTEADIFRRGTYDYRSMNGFQYDGSVNISYNKTFKDKHFVFAGLDYNIRQDKSTSYKFKAEGFSNEKIDFLGAALQYAQNGAPVGNEELKRAIGLTSNVNYMYNNKYFADLSARTDGSSQFGADKRFALFWSLGLGWNMHEEDFLKGSVINRLKLRGSVGTNGSQNFNTYQALSTYKYYTGNRYYSWNGVELLSLGNKDLKWQQKVSYNLGFESQLFKGWLSANFEVYLDKTDDLISSINLPPSNGFRSYVANIGEVKNNGFEFRLSSYIIRNMSKGLSWNIDISGIHNKNKIVKLSEAIKDAQQELENQKATNPQKLYKEGYSINTIWVVRSIGIDPSTGKEIYLKKNGEPSSIWDPSDLIDGGADVPKLQGNINSTLRYKEFTLNFSMGYRLGGQMYNQTLIDKVENADYLFNVDSRVYENRWKQPGDVAAFKGLMNTGTTYKSTRFVQDENTLSFQNIKLRYDFRSWEVMKKSKIESFVLTASSSNLFYLSTVKQERGTSYPFARNFAFGLEIIF